MMTGKNSYSVDQAVFNQHLNDMKVFIISNVGAEKFSETVIVNESTDEKEKQYAEEDANNSHAKNRTDNIEEILNREARSATLLEEAIPHRNASFFSAVWNILPSLQGSSLFSMPYIVSIGGYAVLPAIILMSYMADVTSNMIVECMYETSPRSMKEKRVRKNFTDIARDVWGNIGARVMTYTLAFYLFSGSIVNIVLMSNSLYAIIKPHADLSLTSIMCIFSVLTYPTLFVRRLTTLAYLSMTSLLAIFIAFVSIMYIFIQHKEIWSAHAQTIPWFEMEKFPLAISIILFSCIAHTVIPQVEGSMRERTNFPRVIHLSYACSCVLKITVAILGVLTFGMSTQSIVSLNVESVHPVVGIICAVALSAYALFTYPLCMFIVSDFIDSFIDNSKLKTEKKFYYPWMALTRLSMVATSVLIAWLVPYFGIILGIRGSSIGSCFVFMFPCYFHTKLKWSQLNARIKMRNAVIFTMGTVIGVLGLYSSIHELVKVLKK